MLKRKVESRILEWIRKGNRALLVSGARQVGKTYIIRRCLEESSADFLEINLIREPRLINAFRAAESVDDLVTNLTAVKNHHFTEHETILFIDEVQECSEIVTKIKFWVDDGRFKFVLSGSLLGIELNDLRSTPVGYLEEIQMYPLDFEEFLTASGVPDESIRYIQNAFDHETGVSEPINDTMMSHFRRYLVVGGMPQAVQEYVSSGDIGAVSAIQTDIIRSYRRDFTKYEKKDKKLMLLSAFDQIPSNLLKQNKRFQYSDLKKGLKFEKIENSFLWMTSAGVVIPVYNATEPRVALNQNKKSSLLKLYSSDIGLLSAQYDPSLRYGILTREENLNLGGIFENAVVQELHSHGFALYFYNSHKNGELDLVIESGTGVVPIEIKSGKDYYVHSALSKVVSNPEYRISKAYVFADCNVCIEGSIRYMPVYMCAFLRKEIRMPILQPIPNA